MVYDSNSIVVAGSGQIRVAPPGTAFPTTFISPVWDPAWVELGWTDEKGVVVNDQRTTNDINVWQSLYPALKIAASRKLDMTFNLVEWTRASFSLAFGGGTWTTTTGISSYVPPTAAAVDLRSVAVDFQSQGFNWRWGIYKGLIDANVQTSLTRTGEAILPCQFGILGATTGSPWQVWTDNPAFVPPVAWVATTAYLLNALVTLTTGGGGTVKATTAGTSSATQPTLPAVVGGTIVDGSVTWTRTA